MRLPRRYPLTALAAILACAVVFVFGLGACGNQDPTTPGADQSTTASDGATGPGADDALTTTTLDPDQAPTTVPELPDNDDPSAVQCTGEPKQVFDATAVVSQSFATAADAASAAGCELREVIKDGEHLAATADFRPDRVNVATVDGEVSRIVDIG